MTNVTTQQGPSIKPCRELCSCPGSQREAESSAATRAVGLGARTGSGKLWGSPALPRGVGSLKGRAQAPLRSAGDADGVFSSPEVSKTLRKTRVSLWTCQWDSAPATARFSCFSLHTPPHTHPCLLCPEKYSCVSYFFCFFSLGRRLQRSRRSGCCHGNSRCRNSFGLSLGNPSWSCQAIGSRGGTERAREGREGQGGMWQPEGPTRASRVE